MRGIYGGRLRNAHQVESLTANLISVNRRYKAHAGIRITDLTLTDRGEPMTSAGSQLGSQMYPAYAAPSEKACGCTRSWSSSCARGCSRRGGVRRVPPPGRSGRPHRPPVVEELKVEARERGLWNLFLPSESGLTQLEYAPLAELSGWSNELAPEAMNCQAPDTGNMELLHLIGTPEQQERWLTPLSRGASARRSP